MRIEKKSFILGIIIGLVFNNFIFRTIFLVCICKFAYEKFKAK